MTATEGSGLDRVLRRQDRQYATSLAPSDGLLGSIANIGSIGAGVALCLVADGVLYLGAIGPSERFVAAVADATRDALGPGFEDADRENIVNGLAELERSVGGRRKEAEDVFDRYHDVDSVGDNTIASIDDIDLNDVVAYHRATQDRPTIDLHDVSVYYGSTEPIHVTDVRIRRDRISAWWPAKAQGVQVNYVWNQSASGDEPNSES